MLAISSGRTVPKSATAVDIPVASDELDQLGADRKRIAELQGFEGNIGQTLVLAGATDQAIDVLVGLGARDDITVDTLRRAAAAFVQAVSGHKAVATTLAEQAGSLDASLVLRAIVEGLGLASYSYVDQKSNPTPPTLRKATIVASGAGVKLAIDQGNASVAAVSLARDLVNRPGGSLLPAVFADIAKSAGTAAGLKVTVWDEKRIVKEKLGGLIGVNKGSTHPARFVTLTYTPKRKATARLAFVGKGVTFDSGGLSLKSGVGMMSMKIDMGGAAAVLGAMTLLPILDAPVAVTAYIPLTDNMVNGDATRPGDVLTARNGTTIEVLNTDAEGRLILADALSLAAEAKPDAIIDIATLTGAVTAALGPKIAGVLGTDDVVAACEKASAATSEPVWHLPLPADYRSMLDSKIADLRNIGTGPYGGALTAGLFLQEFTDGLPWAHIDLGVTASVDADDGINIAGGTGVGVRLLAELAANWEA